MTTRKSLQDLVQEAGVNPVLVRQPCLPAPSQPAIVASEDDHVLARNLLVDQRRNDPSYKDPGKQLKRIFRTAKEKDKLQDVAKWEFTQDELDKALSAVIDKPSASAGLVQAFISLGATVNFVETLDQKSKTKQPNVSARRRSTVLQRAATVRRADSVGLLASSGADQTTLDEALRAALACNDHSCVQELLRHGANINTFPNALADAVRSNDQNLVRLLLRAPKSLRTEILSSCLPAAVQQKSEPIISLLIGNGADPNFNDASALKMAISTREYRLGVALVAGSIRTMPSSLQSALEPALRLPTAQEMHQFLQLLLCCGLPPSSAGLSGLLGTACKRNDTSLAQLLLDYGVSAATNEAECLRSAISNNNWPLVDAILRTPLSPSHASVALAVLPLSVPKAERLRIIGALLQKGANGPPLGRWLVQAVEEADSPLMDLLLHAGAPLESSNNRALQLAVMRKDMPNLQRLLNAKPAPETLSALFPLLRSGHNPSERLESSRLFLEHGARGPEVNQALIDAVEDTSNARDLRLITELVRHGADVNFNNGKSIQSSTMQADLPILQLLCRAKPSIASTSAALPMAFGTSRTRHHDTLPIVDLLLANGMEEQPAIEALRIAIRGGPDNLDIINKLISINKRLLGPAFDSAVLLDSPNAKAAIIGHLLGLGIPQDVLNDALVSEAERIILAEHDTSTLKLILAHGASVNHKGGGALGIVVLSGSVTLTKLLLNGKEQPAPRTITRAFTSFFDNLDGSAMNVSVADRLEVANELLIRQVEPSAVTAALPKVIAMTFTQPGFDVFIDILLSYGADVNHDDCAALRLAAKSKDHSLFAKLLSHKPDFTSILPQLPGMGLNEDVLVKLLGLCFDHGCSSDHLEPSSIGRTKTPPLISILKEYPRSQSLVELLFTHGCNPDVTTIEMVDQSVGPETTTALIYALAQPQKRVSSAVIVTLLCAGASSTRAASNSEITPIALAAREGRQDIMEALLQKGADASARDKWNRSALFYASSTSITSTIEVLAAYALKDDGSLQEAARSLQLDVVTILIKQGHKCNFPSRLHGGRNALGELCLNAEITNGNQRSKARQIIRLFLDNGANPRFRARNERSAVILALDNSHNPLEVTEALLETEVWEDLNDEKHLFRDDRGLWYSPIKYVELMPHHSRSRQKQELLDLLRDKGCEPKYYSEHAEQPEGAVGMPTPIRKLANRQKEHELSLKLAQEANEHARMLEEANHRDLLRRKKEQQDAELAAATSAQAQYQTLEQQKHDFEIQRVRSAERMKRSEKVAWHNLMTEQERDFAIQRQQIEDRKTSAQYAHEQRLIKERQAELDHRAGVERRALKDKEELYERNMKRQKEITQRLDESAQLHARLRQERPAIEGPPQWGTVD